ncbi:MAG TPA: glycosyltransferase family 39 protein [Rhizomicrobium sp.]|nr:glycosyltransferase family 39 protein [Rhizomicrobium sp.]
MQQAGKDQMSQTTASSEWQSAVVRRSLLENVSPERAVIAIILTASVIRIALAAATGFSTDESYTVANARIFALSYVDYPPLHAWLVGAWSWLWHSQAPVVLRLPFIALFAGSTWMMFRLASFLFGARAGLWSALLFNLAPVFTLPHASWVLPDGPLTFFLLSGAFVTARLLFDEAEPSPSIAGWMLAGALGGLAMLSKYHGAFLLAGTFVFLLSWKPGRRLLASPGPWLGALAALVVFMPALIWNAHHDWVGLFFQTKRLSGSSHLEFMRVFDSLGAQALYLTPWLFVPLAYVWGRSLARGPAMPQSWYLAMLASGPIIGFTAANIVARGLPHWPMPGWLFMFPILGAEAARVAQIRPKLLASLTAAAAATLIIVVAGFGIDAQNGWITNTLPVLAQSDPMIDLMNWDELNAVISARHLLDKDTPAIAATHWTEAGKLNYIMGRNVPVLCLCADPQEFRYTQDLERFKGRNILVVGAHRSLAEVDANLSGMFDRIVPLAPIMLHRAGKPVIELTVVRGLGLHGVEK